MKMKSGLFGLLFRLRRDDRGSILVQATFYIAVSIGMTGLAVDGARFLILRNSLQDLADAAALAGAAAGHHCANHRLASTADRQYALHCLTATRGQLLPCPGSFRTAQQRTNSGCCAKSSSAAVERIRSSGTGLRLEWNMSLWSAVTRRKLSSNGRDAWRARLDLARAYSAVPAGRC